MANVIRLAEQKYPRIPKGEAKTKDVSSGMDYNSNISKWGNNQVPETKRLVRFYQNPTGDGNIGAKRTIQDSMTNGGKFETEAGEQPGIKNHAVGHIGTHKL